MLQMMRRGHVCLAKIAGCLGVVICLVGAHEVLHSESVLVSQWDLDEGTGPITTDSTGNEIGTLQNGATWTAGHTGAAVSLDGVDDYISVSNLGVGGPALSLTAWVKNSSLVSGIDQRFISKADDATEDSTYWMLGLTGAEQNRLQFRLRAGGVTTTLIASAGDLPLNTWYHVAATYDGSTMRLYLNGTEVDSIAKSGSIAAGGSVPVEIGRSPDGSNYLRGAIDDVGIYRSALDASEVAALVGGGVPANQSPSVSLTSPADGASYPAASTIPVSANASDADGTIVRVEFYAGSTLISTDTTNPYSVSWPNVGAGTYTLKAVAFDEGGASGTSVSRTITVSSPVSTNQPPSISLTFPASGATFTAPGSITLSANASDSDGTIVRVDFYSGSTLLGTDTSSPYSLAWNNVLAGSYSLTAVAHDNAGATTVSSTHDIAVKPVALPSTAVFTPSSNHDTAVDRYVLEIFPLGADTTVANPIGTQDLGKPAINNGECRADVSAAILALLPGSYVATVTAIGEGGSAQSAPSPQFTR